MSWDLARRVIFDLVGPVFNLVYNLVNGGESTGMSGEQKHNVVREEALNMLAPTLPPNTNMEELGRVVDAGIHASVRMKNLSGEFRHAPRVAVTPAPPPGDTIPSPGEQHLPSGTHGGGVQVMENA